MLPTTKSFVAYTTKKANNKNTVQKTSKKNMSMARSTQFLCYLLLLVSIMVTFATAIDPKYQLFNLERTPTGYQGQLKLQEGSGPFGNDIQDLKFQMFYETNTRLHIKITDLNEQRWQLPKQLLKSELPSVAAANPKYNVEFQKYPFGFKVTRNGGGGDNVIFDSSTKPFIFEDQFIQIGTQFSRRDPNIYGLGERVHPLRLNTSDVAYTMFNLDNLNRFRENLYGTHPFYMELKDDRTAYGVFLFNGNAMDVRLEPNALSYRTIGGVIDLYIFLGPEPETVVKQYQEVIGKPILPPFWSFGWHQCKYGYKDLDEVKTVVNTYAKYKLPLEAMWNDIDYMDAYKDFTWDPQRYNIEQVKKFVDDLHNKDQRYVVIIDPAIANEPGYAPYDEGVQKNIFINSAQTGKALVNKQWPGLSVFPDFTNPATTEYWAKFVEKFITDVPIDALWLDMNEISGFCDGVCNTTSKVRKTKAGPFRDVNNPPFVPDNGGTRTLDYKTMSMDAKHYLGQQYDVHNIFANFEINATLPSLQKVTGKRPWIVTRASYAGMGSLATHWLGDNESTWESLKLSISGMLNMNIFGIPMVGADICGFMGNTTMELCARWTQLGSFYPFARNHNTLGSIPQEPYVFGQAFVDMTKNLLAVRYSLLNYFYTLFADVHKHGGTVVRPLFFEFSDPKLEFIDTQFMIGSGLLISPVVAEGARVRDAYFPGEDKWYDFYSGAFLTKGGVSKSLYAPLTFIPVHVRGGSVIPKQFPGLTTSEVRNNPFEILIALDDYHSAYGTLILDDGDSVDTLENGQYTEISYDAGKMDANTISLSSKVGKNGYAAASQRIVGQVTVFGVPSICQVSINGQPTANYEVNKEFNVLRIKTTLTLTDPFTVSFGC